MVMLCFYNWEKVAINDSKIKNFYSLIWLFAFTQDLYYIISLNTNKIVMKNIMWYFNYKNGEIMEIKLPMWHRIFTRNSRIVRKSPFFIVYSLSNNLSLLYFWMAGLQCGLWIRRVRTLVSDWVQILTLLLIILQDWAIF